MTRVPRIWPPDGYPFTKSAELANAVNEFLSNMRKRDPKILMCTEDQVKDAFGSHFAVLRIFAKNADQQRRRKALEKQEQRLERIIEQICETYYPWFADAPHRDRAEVLAPYRPALEDVSKKIAQITDSQKRYPRKGNPNHVGDLVAEAVAGLFRALNAPIGFGIGLDGPSTPYGKTVQLAMRLLDVPGSWEKPAKRVAKRLL